MKIYVKQRLKFLTLVLTIGRNRPSSRLNEDVSTQYTKDKEVRFRMDSNVLARAIVLGLICFLASCSKDNASPACDNEIALAGVKNALYREIGQGGDQYRFTSSLDVKNIETVKVTEEGRECTANLKIMKKYYLPINYEIAVDDEQYYVTFSGVTEGSKENIYKVINNMQPNLVGE